MKGSSRYTPGKWTSGADAALFVETPRGTWKAMAHEDDSTWSVRGPDPDDPLHYASGEVFTADADVKRGDAAGRYAVAKKRARAYIMGQLGRAHASMKRVKTPAQLDREIAESVAGCHACKHGRGRTAHATRAVRPTPYRIKLTPSEMKAVEFARGRYAWPDMLSAHAAEDGSIAFTESEMWNWTDDVDSDAEGGHSPFPLAAPALAEKLQRFYDSRV